MGELEKKEIYACALSMPTPDVPICTEWVGEIDRHVDRNPNDEIYLVGHSLGVPAILRYLESAQAQPIAGAVLVAGPSEKTSSSKIDNFFNKDFNFDKIRLNCQKFCIIHGDNDPLVPIENAKFLSQKFNGELIIVKNGKHLNSSAGWFALPQCLEALNKMIG